jgi:hypothetical protein
MRLFTLINLMNTGPLRLFYLAQVGNDEEVLARQVLPVDNLPADTRVTKVGFWDVGNAQNELIEFGPT